MAENGQLGTGPLNNLDEQLFAQFLEVRKEQNAMEKKFIEAMAEFTAQMGALTEAVMRIEKAVGRAVEDTQILERRQDKLQQVADTSIARFEDWGRRHNDQLNRTTEKAARALDLAENNAKQLEGLADCLEKVHFMHPWVKSLKWFSMTLGGVLVGALAAALLWLLIKSGGGMF